MRRPTTIAATLTYMGWSIILVVLTGVVGYGNLPQPTALGPVPRKNESPPVMPAQATAGLMPREDEAPLAKPTPPRRPADFSLTAEAFYDEVTDNLSAAGKKYGGRVVELTGKVSQLGRNPVDPNGPSSITLGDFRHPVICSTVDKQPWLKCVHGQTVKVRGTVNGSLLFAAVGMQDCEFTVVSGDPATPITAGQLLKDIAADEDAATKKYDGKVVFLSGEFISVKKGDIGANRLIELKGDGKRPIYCDGWLGDDPFLKKLKAGDPVTFLGELQVTNAGKLKLTDDRVELRNAVLTQAPVLPRRP